MYAISAKISCANSFIKCKRLTFAYGSSIVISFNHASPRFPERERERERERDL